MSDETATVYFRKLSELLLSLRVTDQRGGTLPMDEGAERAIDTILSIGANSRKVMLIGNGGSAAIVSHVQNDLCKAVGVPALVFHEQPLLMALANDHGYECVFERPIQLWAQPGDLVIAVSSSGNSPNILGAVRAGRERGCGLITLSGFAPDNPLRQMGDVNFYVCSDTYGYVETVHAALTHFLTDRAAKLAGIRGKAAARA